jgi:serine/threonine protein kinase
LLISKFRQRKKKAKKQLQLKTLTKSSTRTDDYLRELTNIVKQETPQKDGEFDLNKDRVKEEDLVEIETRAGMSKAAGHDAFATSDKVDGAGWELLSLVVHSEKKTVLEFIANVKPSKETLSTTFESERTFIIYAALRGDIEILSKLLSIVPELLNRQDVFGRGPLHYAVKFAKVNALGYLLSQGANPNLQDNSFLTPLHLAAIGSNRDVYLMLLSAGTDQLAPDCYGLTPNDYLSNPNKFIRPPKNEGSLKSSMLSSSFGSYCAPAEVADPEKVYVDDISNGKVILQPNKHFFDRKRTLLDRLGMTRVKKVDATEFYYRDYYTENLDKCYQKQETERELKAKLAAENGQQPEVKPFEVSAKKHMSDDSSDSGIELPAPHDVCASDFIVLDKIGRGGFGEILCVRHKEEDIVYALKSIPKTELQSSSQLRYLTMEKKVLMNFDHPYLLRLAHSFQTSNKVYLAMEYCDRGTLASYISTKGLLTEHQTKVLACELVLAISALHSQKFVHRDIKLDNVLICRDGHVKLSDFGLVKEFTTKNKLTNTFCGSIAYLPPEILDRKGHSYTVDWYLLGELLYEVIVGQPPFYHPSKEALYNNIRNSEVYYPSSMCPHLKNLIKSLIRREPGSRLGGKYGAKEVMSHAFFVGVDWDYVYRKQYPLFCPQELKPITVKRLNCPIPELHANVHRIVTLPFWTYSRSQDGRSL